MTLSPAELRHQESERKKEKIVEVAIRLFGKLGYKKTTTGQIVEEAGISKGLLFLHYKNKKSLFTAAAQQAMEDMILYGSEEVAKAEGDPTEELAQYFRATVSYMTRQPLLLKLFLQEEREFMAFSLETSMDFGVRNICNLLERGIEEGAFIPDLHPEQTARTFTTLMHGLIDWHCRGGEKGEVTEGFLETVIETMRRSVVIR